MSSFLRPQSVGPLAITCRLTQLKASPSLTKLELGKVSNLTSTPFGEYLGLIQSLAVIH